MQGLSSDAARLKVVCKSHIKFPMEVGPGDRKDVPERLLPSDIEHRRVITVVGSSTVSACNIIRRLLLRKRCV